MYVLLQEAFRILTGNDAEDMEVESEDEKEKNNPFKNVLQSKNFYSYK